MYKQWVSVLNRHLFYCTIICVISVGTMGVVWFFAVVVCLLDTVASSTPDQNGIALTSSLVGTRVSLRPGRHVCTTEKTISTPIAVLEKYKKPVYTPHERDCPNLTSCPQYDVSYVLANRTVFQLQKSSTFEHSCCPGWTKGSKREKGCQAPICSSRCGGFGVCVKPEICECRQGYSGTMCDTDIDECMAKDHGCHQMCKNTAGSYVCACHEGFTLAADGRTCLFCFTCQREYLELVTTVMSLKIQLQNTSRDKNILEAENQKLSTQVNSLTQDIADIRALQQNSSGSTNTDKEDRLEERLQILKEEVQNFSKTKVCPEEPDLTYVNATFEEMRKEIYVLREDNDLLRTTVQELSANLLNVTSDVESMRNLTLTVPGDNRNGVDMETTTSGGLQYDPYGMIISLSNQIGLMEEKLHFCQCERRGRG